MHKNTSFSALLLLFALLLLWQLGAMGMDAAYILPSPVQVLVRLWQLRVPLFTAHLPATLLCTGIGLVISIVLGLLLAVLMDVSRWHSMGAVPGYYCIPNHTNHSACAFICIMVRLYHMEQGIGDNTHHFFSNCDYSI